MKFLNGIWQDERDRQAMGPPELSCELPGDLTLGLYIPAPFGRHTDATLMIRAIDNGDPGGIITLAIGTVIARQTPVDVPLHSNPRRHVDVDYWREDGA